MEKINTLEDALDFAIKLENGMTITEIVAESEISTRTAYRYLAYYRELQKVEE